MNNGQGQSLPYEFKKGLDLPITGEPDLAIEAAADVKSVAVIGTEYVGMKPTMAVKVGDPVKLGQLLFSDKMTPGIRYTSPACGEVVAINRGQKRILQSVVIAVNGDEEETFGSYPEDRLSEITRDEVEEKLLTSGLWPVLRTRPYSKVPPPGTTPHSIFVNAMDTNPLAFQPHLIITERKKDFINGLTVLSKLTEGTLYLCHAPGTILPGADLNFVTTAEFKGPHPAGLVGTHIHVLDPVSAQKTVWHLNYQDVLAIGSLFTTGKINVERIISLAGPMVKRPRFLRTRIGAHIEDIVNDELKAGEVRVISGSVFYGQIAVSPFDFLGRYHLQISVIAENRERMLLDWQLPGFNKFSIISTFISKLIPGKRFAFSSTTGGSERAMVPIGMYEKIMPLDIMITFLLRALIVEDTDQAQALGCLELDEEDLALSTFVCPGKYDYGPMLRQNLTQIEMDG